MVKLTHLSAIVFSGADAGDFLHSQLSADVLGLADGDSTFACYCEPKGRVLALMLVQKINDDYYVIMSSELTTLVTNRLAIYRMRSKVVFDVLDEHTILGIHSDKTTVATPGSEHVIRVPGSIQSLLVSSRNVSADTSVASMEEWRVSELSRGITWLNTDTSGEFLPQMLGFDALGAVNYRKGCYPGQEIVARTHYLGKVKRHPRLLSCRLKNRPNPMEKIKIFDGEQYNDATVVDCGIGRGGNICLMTVTRMDPDKIARQVVYLDEIAAVL